MAGPLAGQQTPKTPCGRHQMITRNRTPQGMNYHKPSARPAQLQPSAACMSNSHCADQHTPGTCCTKMSVFFLSYKQLLTLKALLDCFECTRWIINLEREKHPSFFGPGCGLL